MANIDFSLIVACYNEEDVLRESIAKIEHVFASTNIKYEIIFVDDKSTDKTLYVIDEILSTHPEWRLIKHAKNMGRGRTVSDGIKIAKARIVGFIDIDLSTSPWYLLPLIDEIEKGADIVTAMRVYKLKPRTIFRWFISKGYNLIMRVVLNCNLTDTETGCKVFNRERILPILDTIDASHWFWDTEIMIRALIIGYKIVEIPSIFIREGMATTVHIFKDTKDYLINLIKFRRQLKKMRSDAI